ncbi:MAG TPA: ROK family protein [Acidimicrobiales bacterium]|jgi:glucokinase
MEVEGVGSDRPVGAETGRGEGMALAVDIGGTKLAVGLVDERGRLGWQESAPTPATTSADALWAVLAALVARAPTAGAAVCGVGSGGPMTPNGEVVSPLNIPAWRDFPLRARLAELTGLGIFVDNDAKALALAEGWRGAAVGVDNYVAMVVSTGVGGGIVLDGRLLDGAGGNAGHIGHVVVVPGGRRCACGGRGCLEAEASGTAIAAMTGRPAAEAGAEVVARTGRLVGQAVASVANLLDLRLAVVAGSVALGYGTPFFSAAQAELDALARLSYSRGARIRPGGLGADGPLVGAAAVGWRGIGRLSV